MREHKLSTGAAHRSLKFRPRITSASLSSRLRRLADVIRGPARARPSRVSAGSFPGRGISAAPGLRVVPLTGGLLDNTVPPQGRQTAAIRVLLDVSAPVLDKPFPLCVARAPPDGTAPLGRHGHVFRVLLADTAPPPRRTAAFRVLLADTARPPRQTAAFRVLLAGTAASARETAAFRVLLARETGSAGNRWLGPASTSTSMYGRTHCVPGSPTPGHRGPRESES